MRLLLLSHEFTITGASTILFRLALHLRRSGHDVAIMAIDPTPGPFRSAYLEHGFAIVDTLPSLVIDLVIGNTICAAPKILRLPPALRVVWWIHEAEIGLNVLLRYPQCVPAFRRANAIVYQTAFQRDDVFRSFTYDLDPKKSHIVPNGIRVDRAELAGIRVAPKRRSLRIVSVGTIEPRKRHEDVIRAIASLKQIDIELVICGKMLEIADEAMTTVRNSPDRMVLLIDLPGREPVAWIDSADMFCLASSSETQGIAAFEAALLGKPLILSNLPCYRGIFEHGVNALLYPPGDVEMLAYAIATLAGSPTLRRRLGDAARRTATEFNEPIFFARFDTVIAGVTAAPS